MDAHTYYHVDTMDTGHGFQFVIVSRNEGMGGTHSEPAALIKVQRRSLTAGRNVYLFTERAPCVNCQQSLRLHRIE